MLYVKSPSYPRSLGWLGFGLVERSVKEQSYEDQYSITLCFNNESSSEIIEMNWTRLRKGVEFENYIHIVSSLIDLIDIDRNPRSRRPRRSIDIDRSPRQRRSSSITFSPFGLAPRQARNIISLLSILRPKESYHHAPCRLVASNYTVALNPRML